MKPALYLVIVEGAEPGERIPLGEEPIVIGREAPADLLLPDPLVSRRHCRVSLMGDEAFVFDLGSTNGTYIDGKLVMGSTPLPKGAHLEIGDHILQCAAFGSPD